MKIGIAGYGYWGKIICENLYLLGYDHIKIYDPALTEGKTEGRGTPICNSKECLYDCEKVFVLSPCANHFDICSDLLKRKISVFCEKPPALNSAYTWTLYELAEENDVRFFVDWTFIYNDAVWKIRDYIEQEGYPNSIIMNRMNYGPVREDVSAKLDLASHDVAICEYLISEQQLKGVRWNEYNFLNGKQSDTCFGLLAYDTTVVQINVSWSAQKKIRTCIFNFPNETFIWDDNKKTIEFSDKTYYSKSSPVANSIRAFLEKPSDFDEKMFSVGIMEILERAN